jgi:type IV pilus assembly protein PilV
MSNNTINMTGRRQQRGIALLEAMIATVILAIGLLGTIGLQARAYSAMSDASMRAEAVIASEKLFGLMSTDIANLSNYAVVAGGTPGASLAKWAEEVRGNATATPVVKGTIPNAVISVAVAPNSNGTNSTAVTVKISWTRKSGGPANTSTMTSYLSGST